MIEKILPISAVSFWFLLGFCFFAAGGLSQILLEGCFFVPLLDMVVPFFVMGLYNCN